MNLDRSALRISVEEHERWRRTLHIVVPADAVRQEQEDALQRLAGSSDALVLPKGKAPPARRERQAQAALQEAIARVVDEAYRTALKASGLDPIDEGEIGAVRYQPDSELSFRVSFDVAPEIEITRLEGFHVELSRRGVGPQDVEGVIARLLSENAIWRPAEDDGTPSEGDLVTIELERIEEAPPGTRREDGAARSGPPPIQELGLPWLRRLRLRDDTRLGKRFQLVLGEGDAVPELEQAIRGLTPGEACEVVIPADAAGQQAARPLRLGLVLVDRRMRELPELDDAFARSLGPFESVEALRREVRSGLEREARDAADERLRNTLLDAAADANPFDVPRSLVERYLDEALGDTSGADPDAVGQLRKELEREAEAAVKRRLVAEAIAALEGLAATPEEVEERVAAVARIAGVRPEQVRDRLARSNRLDALVRDITEAKVAAFLRARAVVVEKPDPAALRRS